MNDAASAAIAVTAIVSLCASCADSTAGPVGEPTPRPAPDTVIDWGEPADRVVFAETGWAIRACEGDAPSLCVEHFARPVGLIEANGYDEDGCPGRDELSGFTSVGLAEFRRYLEQVLRASPLPAVPV